MGYQNEHAERIVFDIETAPLPEAAGYLEPVEAPSNYKDETKIAAYIAEKQAEQMERCGLDVDLCRVVAIGYQCESEESQAIITGSEASIINSFWAAADGRHMVGFGCVAFDLPVLLRRSLYLGVKTPALQLDRYRHPGVTDLLQLLSMHGALRMRSLSFYAKRFGFPVADTLTGADIALAVKEGRWNDVRSHVSADVQKTALLAEKLGYFTRATVGAAF